MDFCCRFMEVALLIGLMSTLILGQVTAWLPAGKDISMMGGIISTNDEMLMGRYPDATTLAMCNLLRDCILSVIFWSFYNVFRSIRAGEIFSLTQIKRISISGWGFVVLSLYSMLSDMLLTLLQSPDENLQYYFQVENLIYIPLGVGLVMLSYILQLALVIKEEQELVI